MNFGTLMSWQGLLLLGGSAAVAVWLFRLKLRPPKVAVPSLILWRDLASQPRPLSWWDRVRRAVSLALTVVLAVVLAAALARSMASRGRSTDRVLLVMDSSLSMQARLPGGGTRWSRAVAEAKREAGASGEVILATTADGVLEGPTSDIALIETALDTIAPHAADAGAWPRLGGVAATHFFTDGAFRRALDSAVIVHAVHEDAPNIAITAFGARPATSSTAGGEAYLEVSNYAPVGQPTHVTVTRGTAVVFDRQLNIAPGEVVRQVIPLESRGDPRLRAHVTGRANALAIDDEAVAWMEESRLVRVAIVSARPEAYVSLLERDSTLHVQVVSPSAYRPSDADVFVFDRWLPAEAPVKPALCVLPPTTAWLGASGDEERLPEWRLRQSHDVFAGVDLPSIEVRRARGYTSASLFALATSARGAALVSVRDLAESRLVVLGFGLDDANAQSTVALPVLLGNALEWLARPRLAAPGPPGPRVLPPSTTRVTAPSGQRVPLVATGERAVVRLDDPGLYLVELGGARSVMSVAVNNPELSNLSMTTVPAGAPRGQLSMIAASHPWWAYAVTLALVLACVEWWTWQRRITV